MTVKDLIEKLEKLDQTREIKLRVEDNDSSHFEDPFIGTNPKDEPEDEVFYYIC